MNIGQKLLALGVLVFASSTIALADPVGGVINVSGHDTFSSSSLTFITPFASLGDTGVFSDFSNGTVDYYLGTVNPLAPAFSLMTFSVTDSSGNMLTFYINYNDATLFTDPTTGFLDLTNDETGYYTLNGGPQMAGFFDVTFYGTSADGATDSSFAGSGGLFGASGSEDGSSVAPEPSSWLLLGTALVTLTAAAAFSRRQRTAGLTA